MVEGKINTNDWPEKVKSLIGERYLLLYKKDEYVFLLDMEIGKIFKCWKEEGEKKYTIELAEKSLSLKIASFFLRIGQKNPFIIQRTFQILHKEDLEKAFKKYVEAYFRYAVDVAYQIDDTNNRQGKTGDSRIVTFWLTFLNEGSFAFKKSLPVYGYRQDVREKILTEYLKEWLLGHIKCAKS